MRVAAFFLAREAQVHGSHLDVKGGFPNLFADASYPTRTQAFAVVVIEHVPTEELINVSLEIDVLDPQEQVVGTRLRGDLSLASWSRDVPIGLPVYASSAVPLTLDLAEPGSYAVVLRLDDEEVSRFSFHARLFEAGQPS
jgi:hypothetical protein